MNDLQRAAEKEALDVVKIILNPQRYGIAFAGELIMTLELKIKSSPNICRWVKHNGSAIHDEPPSQIEEDKIK